MLTTSYPYCYVFQLQVLSSPLTQKIQFLESKGLSSSEIERALHLASTGSGSGAGSSEERGPTTQDERSDLETFGGGYGQGRAEDQSQNQRYGSGGGYASPYGPGYGYGQGMMMPKPELPRRDWRDYFVRPSPSLRLYSTFFLRTLLTVILLGLPTHYPSRSWL